jgi:hypothetical protein
MKKKLTNLFILILLPSSSILFAQEQFRYKVVIPAAHFKCDTTAIKESLSQPSYKNFPYVYQLVTQTEKSDVKFQKDGKLIESKEYTLDKKKYKYEYSTLLDSDTIYVHKKKKKVAKCWSSDPKYHRKYSANLHVSNDTIYVNFWLPGGFGDMSPVEQKSVKPNPQEKYFMTLKNRESVTFRQYNWEIGAMTIPFKIYNSFYKNKQNVTGSSQPVYIKPDVSANLNIGLYGGFRVGRVYYTYDKYKKMVEKDWSWTFPLFVGFNQLTLDQTNTLAATLPYEDDESIKIGALSIGTGAVYNIRNISLGLYLGSDVALGTRADDWDYNERLWIGVGFGYKLKMLGKKE